MLCLPFYTFFFFKHASLCGNGKVEKQASQPAWGTNSSIQEPSSYVLKQDKYLAHGLFSLSLLPRQEDLTGMME